MFKTSLRLLVTISAVVMMVACSRANDPVETQPSSNLAETQSTLITDTYRRQSEKHEGVWTDMEVVHQDDVVEELWLRYNYQITEKMIEERGLSSKEEMAQSLKDRFYASAPELRKLEDLKGVLITSNLNEDGIWRFSIRVNPKQSDFVKLKEIVGDGDFEILADAEDTRPGEFLIIFKMAGFEEISK